MFRRIANIVNIAEMTDTQIDRNIASSVCAWVEVKYANPACSTNSNRWLTSGTIINTAINAFHAGSTRRNDWIRAPLIPAKKKRKTNWTAAAPTASFRLSFPMRYVSKKIGARKTPLRIAPL